MVINNNSTVRNKNKDDTEEPPQCNLTDIGGATGARGQ